MRQVVGVVLVAVLLVFVCFNLERTQIWFFGVRAEMPLAFLVLFSAALGAAAHAALFYVRRRPKA